MLGCFSFVSCRYSSNGFKEAPEALTAKVVLQAILRDFGITVGITILSDATAATGMVQREGLGRVRHLAVGDLWVQQRVRRGEIVVNKWPSEENYSDMLTKPLDGPKIWDFMHGMHYFSIACHHELAPAL